MKKNTGRPKVYDHESIKMDLLYGKVERPMTIREIAQKNKCSTRVVMQIKEKLKAGGE